MKEIKVLLKIHPQGLVAVCDSNLIGKIFKEKKLQLKVSEQFYKGEEKSEEEIIKILKDSGNANIVGEKAVNLSIKCGIISKNHILKISGIPHAQKISI